MIPLYPFLFLFLLSFLPLTLSNVSFPITAISHYSELSPCAVSHVSEILDESYYDGCSSATPISAYGSCLCAQRLRSVQSAISVAFVIYDDECSSTGLQPYLTAFCGQWGVDIGAAEKSRPSSTTTLLGAGGGAETGQGVYSSVLTLSGSALGRKLTDDPLYSDTRQHPKRRPTHPNVHNDPRWPYFKRRRVIGR